MSPKETPDGDRRREEAERLLTDLHYAILENLPDEGKKMGLSPMAVTVKHLKAVINAELPPEERLRSTTITAEIRSLSTLGLMVRVVRINGETLGWQRSRRAAELVKERDAHLLAAKRAQEMIATSAASLPQPTERVEGDES